MDAINAGLIGLDEYTNGINEVEISWYQSASGGYYFLVVANGEELDLETTTDTDPKIGAKWILYHWGIWPLPDEPKETR